MISAYARSLGATASMGGAIVGMYSASNLVGNVGAGLLLDRLNRKRLIALGMLLTAAALYLYDFASTPGQLLALRAFHGLVAGVLAPGAFAMLGDRTTLHRTRSIGMSGALIAISAVIGPPLAGYIRDLWGFGAVFATSGTLMLLAAMVFLIKVPSMPIEAVRDRTVAGTRTSTPTWRGLTPVFCAVLAMTFGIGSLINHLPIALELAGAAPRISGIAFATFSLMAAVVMASPAHRAIDGVSRRLAVSLGFALLWRQRPDTGSLQRSGGACVSEPWSCSDSASACCFRLWGRRSRISLRVAAQVPPSASSTPSTHWALCLGPRYPAWWRRWRRPWRTILRQRGGSADSAAHGGLHTSCSPKD